MHNLANSRSASSPSDNKLRCGLCAYRPAPVVQKGSPYDYKTLQSRASTTCNLANAILFSGFMTSPSNKSDIHSFNIFNTYESSYNNKKDTHVKSLRKKLRRAFTAFHESSLSPVAEHRQTDVSAENMSCNRNRRHMRRTPLTVTIEDISLDPPGELFGPPGGALGPWGGVRKCHQLL